MSGPVRAIALLALAGLAGCALIDQRSFNSQAGVRPSFPAPPVPAVAAVEPGPKPLLTVRPPVDPAALRGDVGKAVAAARRLKPGVVFEVVAIGADGLDRGAQAASGAQANVAQAIVAQGVPPGRVHLVARPASAGATEVRVYVR